MPYIGSSASPLPVNFAAVQAQSFNGTGSQTAFTLSRTVPSAASIEVLVNNVQQSPYDDSYSVSGTTLTFSEAPSSGTNNVYVVYRDQSLGSLVDTGAVRKTDDVGAALIPVGTTAQRPAGSPGMIRHNSTTGEPEWYDTVYDAWRSFRDFGATYPIEYLVIAGGGGNAVGQGGNRESGSGAGGYRSSVAGESSGGGASAEAPLTFTAGAVYTVIIGAGGSGHANGSDSTLSSITSIGGGRGANDDFEAGVSGGSGGGGWYTGAGGSGTAGQGYAGSTSGGTNSWTGGAGGGAGSAGSISGNTSVGGAGVASSITGSSVTRAAGGAGNTYSGAIVNASGASNTGNGASGVGNGGSGIVIIRYAGAQRGTGGTVTSSGGYTIHTFTSSGTFTA